MFSPSVKRLGGEIYRYLRTKFVQLCVTEHHRAWAQQRFFAGCVLGVRVRRVRLSAVVYLTSAHFEEKRTYATFVIVFFRSWTTTFIKLAPCCMFPACVPSVGRPRAGGGAGVNRPTSVVAQASFSLQVETFKNAFVGRKSLEKRQSQYHHQQYLITQACLSVQIQKVVDV